MALRRSTLLLLGAIIALLVVPASASAQIANLPPSGAGGWVKSGYKVTWPPSYSWGYPIDEVEWKVNGGSLHSGPATSTVTLSESDGPRATLTTRIRVGPDWSNEQNYYYDIDDSPPLDLTSVEPFWRNGPVDVPLVGSADGSSPVAKFQWRLGEELQPIDTVGFEPWTAHVVPDGRHKLYTRAVDMAGNVSSWKTHDVYIDSQRPLDQTNVKAGWYTTSPVTIDVEGTDVTSGIESVRWRKGTSGAFTEVTGTSTPVTFSGEGQHALDTELVDKAGHVSATEHHMVKIDLNDPVDTTPPAPTLTVNSPHTVTVSGTDGTGSGIDHVEWKVNGGPLQTGASGSQATLVGHGVGAATLETRVVDNAGRASAWTTRKYDLDAKTNDSTPPVVTTDDAITGWYTYPVDVAVAADDEPGIGVRNIQWHVENVKDPADLEHQTVNAETATIELHKEGEYLVRTWANDKKGNKSSPREQSFNIDLKVPVNTTELPTGWQKSRTFKLSATDSASGVERIEYSINGGLYQRGTQAQSVDVGADGKFVVSTRVFDHAGQQSAARTAPFWVDRTDPDDDTLAPPTDWRRELTHDVAGSDDLSGVKVVRWRVDGGEIHEGSPAVIDTEAHTLETQVVDNAGNETAWRSFPVNIDRTAPENTTEVPAGWLNTPPDPIEIEGTDARSGVDKIEVELNGEAVSTPVTITGDRVHKLRSRLIDEAGNASAWREDEIKIDSTAPKTALSCSAGSSVWSSAPVSCTVTADGGLSGLGSATLSGADGGTASVTSGATAWVSSDGTHTLQLTAKDGAGNPAGATAVVNVDRTAPGAGLSCAAANGKYSCAAQASDGLSGVVWLGWSVDGGAWTPIAAGTNFTLATGVVRVRAIDAAGNEFVTEPVTLPAIPPPPLPPAAKVRISNVPVYLAGRDNVQSMLGALNAVRSANGTVSLDLRPLAVGRGRFRVEIALQSGKHAKKVKRSYKVGRTGALPRISASLSKAVAKTTITLTVRKQAGRRWRKHAGTRLVLPK